MNVTTSRTNSVVVLRVHEPRLTYPVLADVRHCGHRR